MKFVVVKKTRFIKEQEAKGLLSITGKIPLLGPLLIQLKTAYLNTLKNNRL